MSQLETLVNHRQAILLAEAIGWLHDYRKCSHDPNQRPPRTQLAQELENKGFPGILSNPNLLEFYFSSSHIEREKLEILLDDRQWLSDEKLKLGQNSASLLLQFLSRCHNTPTLTNKNLQVENKTTLMYKPVLPLVLNKVFPVI
ncbi:hypothetical protein [Leptothermofonsia sp. ETS-13]|uniref:hypothetical protein n=1 Tax=Leptothermofonsia sp. ETS-13 TaxID=3035696 RepID=UPI003B9E033D